MWAIKVHISEASKSYIKSHISIYSQIKMRKRKNVQKFKKIEHRIKCTCGTTNPV